MLEEPCQSQVEDSEDKMEELKSKLKRDSEGDKKKTEEKERH